MELTPLYTIVSSSNFAEFDNYCAIILQLGDEMLKKVSNGVRFVLTVWEKGGRKIFQEYLVAIPYCWNTIGSKIIYMKDRITVCIIDCEGEDIFRTFRLTRPVKMPEPAGNQPPRLVGLTGEHLIVIEPLAGSNRRNLACWRITGMEHGQIEAKNEINMDTYDRRYI